MLSADRAAGVATPGGKLLLCEQADTTSATAATALVAIEVSVIGRTDQRVNPDSFAFDEQGLESLDRQAV